MWIDLDESLYYRAIWCSHFGPRTQPIKFIHSNPIQVYRTLVRAGLETCLETSEKPLNEVDNLAIYDSHDYKSAYLQVGDSHLSSVVTFINISNYASVPTSMQIQMEKWPKPFFWLYIIYIIHFTNLWIRSLVVFRLMRKREREREREKKKRNKKN